jgi:hypothetical protein
LKRAFGCLASIVNVQKKAVTPSILEQNISPCSRDHLCRTFKDHMDKWRQLIVAKTTEPVNVAEEHRTRPSLNQMFGAIRHGPRRADPQTASIGRHVRWLAAIVVPSCLRIVISGCGAIAHHWWLVGVDCLQLLLLLRFSKVC